MSLTPRKLWIAIASIVLLLVSIASFLPLQSNVTESIKFHAHGNALFRQLTTDSLWRNWWPASRDQSDNVLRVDGFVFKTNKIYANSFELSTKSNSLSTTSTLRIISENDNSVTLIMSSSLSLSRNPIQRIKELVLSSRLKNGYGRILAALANHYSRIENLYGFDIKVETVSHEHITTTSKTFSQYPTTSEIYSMIGKVRLFIEKNDGDTTGYPMLFVKEIGNRQYYTQVGIPTNKALASNEEIKSKQMLKGGAILVAKVVGGQQAIYNAVKQMEFYIQDNNFNTVAIPYEYLITNRLEIPDSSKWETEIYFPILI